MLSHLGHSNVNMKNVYFSENDATMAGSSLYGSLLDRCTGSHLAERNIDNNKKLQSAETSSDGITYLKAVSNNKIVNIGSPPVKICFCEDNQLNFTNQHTPIFTERGNKVTVLIAVLDEVNNEVRNAEVYGFVKGNDSGFCRYESR